MEDDERQGTGAYADHLGKDIADSLHQPSEVPEDAAVAHLAGTEMNELVSFFDRLIGPDREQAVLLLRDVLENLPDAAFIMGERRRNILWCNAAATEIFGYSRKELIGAGARVLHIDDKRFAQFGRRFREALDNGECYRGRYWLRSKTGRRFPTEHIIMPLRRVGGRPVYVSIVRCQRHLPNTLEPEHLDRLTEREREVFEATARGLSAKEVAYLLEISPRTVELHRAHVLEKLELGSLRELMGKLWDAVQAGGKPSLA